MVIPLRDPSEGYGRKNAKIERQHSNASQSSQERPHGISVEAGFIQPGENAIDDR